MWRKQYSLWGGSIVLSRTVNDGKKLGGTFRSRAIINGKDIGMKIFCV